MKEEDRDDKGEEGRTSQQKRARDASDAPASVTSDEDQRAKLTPVIKSQPNFVFASWLCSMLGQERLRGGSGVIDIAGGNGLLSFELTCRYGEEGFLMVVLYSIAGLTHSCLELSLNRYTINSNRPSTNEI